MRNGKWKFYSLCNINRKDVWVTKWKLEILQFPFLNWKNLRVTSRKPEIFRFPFIWKLSWNSGLCNKVPDHFISIMGSVIVNFTLAMVDFFSPMTCILPLFLSHLQCHSNYSLPLFLHLQLYFLPYFLLLIKRCRLVCLNILSKSNVTFIVDI